jgi:hypothetical protein
MAHHLANLLRAQILQSLGAGKGVWLQHVVDVEKSGSFRRLRHIDRRHAPRR